MNTRIGQRGFTLTNVLLGIGLAVLAISGYKIWHARKLEEEINRRVIAQAEAIRGRYLNLIKLDNAWRNSLAASENTSLECLRTHSSCPVKESLMLLRDGQNRTVFDSSAKGNGLTFEGTNCAGFVESGNDNCPFRLDLTWAPECLEDCTDPHTVLLKGRLRFRPAPNGSMASIKLPDLEFEYARVPVPGVPRNCQELLLNGQTGDGLYSIKPDGAEYPFPIYCDQTRDGGGWALVVAAANNNYSAFIETAVLIPGNSGRLANAKIKAYLDNTAFPNFNNLRLEMPDVDGGLVLSASSNGGSDPEAYEAPTTVGNCQKLSGSLNTATHSAASGFSLFFRGPGEAGIQEKTTPSEGFYGFTACFGSTIGGRDCGVGCGRKWRGQLFRQKGTLWIR